MLFRTLALYGMSDSVLGLYRLILTTGSNVLMLVPVHLPNGIPQGSELFADDTSLHNQHINLNTFRASLQNGTDSLID